MPNNVIEVSDDDFRKKVLGVDKPVLAVFWANWCYPCKSFMPVLERISDEYAGKILVVKIDVDKYTEMAYKYNVLGIPTTLFIYQGGVLHNQLGAVPEPMFRYMLKSFLYAITMKRLS